MHDGGSLSISTWKGVQDPPQRGQRGQKGIKDGTAHTQQSTENSGPIGLKRWLCFQLLQMNVNTFILYTNPKLS